jgi:hypothetical protein
MANWLCPIPRADFGSLEASKQALYFAFDLPWLNGEDLKSAAFRDPKGKRFGDTGKKSL